ncbi:MAG: glycerol kinase GlpK [Proteobacteria bacterium]|nr:glycerol kinase GlpK [Pseudomonadota bacterium]
MVTVASYVLALDQGTTSSRSVLVDRAGEIVASAQAELTQSFPQTGWVEHDPNEIWSTQAATIAAVLAKADVSPRQLAAVGIANQRETTVLWDRHSGQPVAPAIVWQDRRTAAACDLLRATGVEPDIVRRTGLRLDPYFSATKLAWLLDTIPGARARATRGELAFGTVDSWLVYKLTGHRQHVTDATNASRTMLVNLQTGDWDPEMLRLLQIPPACLPTIVATARAATSMVADIAGHPVPLTGIAGDQHAALFGQACFAPGMAKNTYGTGCFLLANTGDTAQISQHKLLTTVAWQIDQQRQFALEGSVFVGGAVVQWLRDGLGIVQHAADSEALAASVPDSDGVYCVPAFTGLGSPHWDPHARGAFFGLTRGTTRAHIARAALESIAFQSADLLAAMQLDSGTPITELRVDGGATANNLLMQFQADILGIPVVRPRYAETTALGAAYLAGLGVNFWSSQDEIAANWQSERRFLPQLDTAAAQARLVDWARAVERTRGWSRPAAPNV